MALWKPLRSVLWSALRDRHRPLAARAATTLVLLTGVMNLVLVAKVILDVEGVGRDELGSYIPSVLLLLAATLAPVAAMLVVTLIPTPAAVGRWCSLVGAVLFLLVDLAEVSSVLLSDSSTAVIGLIASVPVLLFLVLLLAVPVAVSNDRAKSKQAGSGLGSGDFWA